MVNRHVLSTGPSGPLDHATDFPITDAPGRDFASRCVFPFNGFSLL